jgi:hypothetical protein
VSLLAQTLVYVVYHKLKYIRVYWNIVDRQPTKMTGLLEDAKAHAKRCDLLDGEDMKEHLNSLKRYCRGKLHLKSISDDENLQGCLQKILNPATSDDELDRMRKRLSLLQGLAEKRLFGEMPRELADYGRTLVEQNAESEAGLEMLRTIDRELAELDLTCTQSMKERRQQEFADRNDGGFGNQGVGGSAASASSSSGGSSSSSANANNNNTNDNASNEGSFGGDGIAGVGTSVGGTTLSTVSGSEGAAPQGKGASSGSGILNFKKA